MRQIFFVVILLLSTLWGSSQISLNFCGGVDPNGACIYNNDKFFFPPDSTDQRIFVEIHDVSFFTNTAKFTFKFYSIAKDGAETYIGLIEQEVRPDWMFAWVGHTFTTPGKYNVKVFNDKDELVIDRSLEFFNGK